MLGYVGVDDNGLGGMEQKFDCRLHGEPGRMYAAMDARRHVMGSTEREPEPGENLVLTIDENIQFIAEKALDAAMPRTHADERHRRRAGRAYRPDSRTRDSSDLQSQRLSPHHAGPAARSRGQRCLRARLDLQAGHLRLGARPAIVKPDDMIDCQGGAITFNGRTIHDDKSDHYGVITVHEALEHSSDVAAVKLALRMGPDHFYEYIRNFGFGSKTGVELPGETRGLLRQPAKWGSTSIGSIAIGQEVAVTPSATGVDGFHHRQRRRLSSASRVLTTQDKDGHIAGQQSTQLAPCPFIPARIFPIHCPLAPIA